MPRCVRLNRARDASITVRQMRGDWQAAGSADISVPVSESTPTPKSRYSMHEPYSVNE